MYIRLPHLLKLVNPQASPNPLGRVGWLCGLCWFVSIHNPVNAVKCFAGKNHAVLYPSRRTAVNINKTLDSLATTVLLTDKWKRSTTFPRSLIIEMWMHHHRNIHRRCRLCCFCLTKTAEQTKKGRRAKPLTALPLYLLFAWCWLYPFAVRQNGFCRFSKNYTALKCKLQ